MQGREMHSVFQVLQSGSKGCGQPCLFYPGFGLHWLQTEPSCAPTACLWPSQKGHLGMPPLPPQENRVCEVWDSLGQKRSLHVTQANPCSKGRDANKKLSSWIWGILKAAHSTASLGNRLQTLMTFIVKNTYEYLPLIFSLHYCITFGML